ncbi:cytochrome c heme lyase [Micractinium conductrix]|uniref:Holocytochrome c-type synthase n=1 Tax=Micractinium conductrix TaxID=554055 RepID=A0A2P6VAA9_9CHLO|nr:cytochrome c heme lyase [Micractinium conductrix]|eukprot:PSC71026.1 cytochrome c heme lyase [Micractinium conductrix]
MGNRASREANAAGDIAGSPVAAAPPSVPPPRPLPAECPVPAEFRARAYKNPAVYNVYNERINDPSAQQQQQQQQQRPLAGLAGQDVLDPKNNMPLDPNQQPCAGQRKLLSTDRQASNIPKGGTESTWVYPSPQMFFNALRRKGKGDDVSEEDMEAVVFNHNTMNELTWREVARWESLHYNECGAATLLRFRGRPDDLSPLARLSSWFGGPLPFDRHDWWVDRCGEEVRYVIDFYFDDDKAGSPEAFGLRVRPAIDSPTAALDRAKMWVYENFAQYGLPCPVTGHPPSVGSRGGGSSGSGSAAAAAAQQQQASSG